MFNQMRSSCAKDQTVRWSPLFAGAPGRRGAQAVGWAMMLAVLLLVVAPAAGQGPTGQVLGHVTDSEGAAVSGATVILQSQEIEDPLVVTTDADGFYNATNVRPATYQVSVEATGYAGAPASLAVRVGSIQRVNFELAATEELSEEITVVSERPQIESVDSRVNKYITFEEIQSLPLPNRSFLDVLKILPGVHGGLAAGGLDNSAPNNSFSIHGARMNQNQFLIDGVANNDLSDLNYDDLATSETRAGPRSSGGAGQRGSTFSTGTALQTYNLDAIQEVQVSTSMFSAEYGNASGAVINIITRSGADRYNASATVQQQHDGVVEPGFVGTTADDAEQLEGQDFTIRQGSLTLGGPINRGTTHFFTSYEHDDQEMGYDYNQSHVFTRAVPVELGLTANVTNRDRLTGKLTHQFSDSNDLTVSGNWVSEQAAIGHSLFRSRQQDIEHQDHANDSLGLSVRHVAAVGSDMTLESVLGQIQADRSMESSADPLRRLRLYWHDDGGLVFHLEGAIGPEVDNTLESFQWKERLSWLRGDHSLRAGAGVERFGQRTEQPAWRNWGYGFVDDFSVPPASGVYQFATDIDVSVTNSHLFIQDDWFVNDRWTFNLGGRYDRNNLVDDQTVEARLGAAVDVGRNGRSVLRFGAGLYHDRTNLIGHTGADRPPLLFNVPIDPVTLEMDPTRPGSPPRELIVDPNLHLPEIVKWNVGYERELGERNTLSIHVFGSDSDGLFFTDFQNRESFEHDGARPDPTRGLIRIYSNTGYSEVLDVEVEFKRRFANGSLVHVSYTNQDAFGSSYFDLISGNSTLNRAARLESDNPPALFNGPLNTEVAHSYKLSAVGNLPWGLQLSGFLDYRSGTPFTVRDSEFMRSPGGFAVYPSVLFEGFNSRNAPDYFSADVRLAKNFTIGDRHGLLVFLDVFNATDRTNVIEVDGLRSYNNSGRLGEPGTITRDDFPRIRNRGPQRSAQFGIRWSM